MPSYDFHCDACDTTETLRRRMARAGDPATCRGCGAPMRRLYDTTLPVIFRPWGYRLHPEDPRYWDHFDDPLPGRPDVLKGVSEATARRDHDDPRTD